ncbi:pyruvate:ferredoxin (flavodoxin) oxidoreductase [Neptunomonas antarctica]|uniref:Pyruvate-flavodoxin oxidoreductase n=1 Tax=Neptunomonas antarctica TaxID=619304 RepID=A0A1N7IUB9_9GAMM|nr:pyruvate:ferredoxin (flavodoxin) oxidoreductase [Neptunomonas antarctica]SIS40682.1 pyruvate-ferredoxin/flavodoxin oxidoreductase [Neptunomonas antarctica]
MAGQFRMMDGNEAAAYIAYQLNDVIAIYPITPASPMGELSDAWSASGKPNLWGTVPDVIELQSEAGAAGAVHGALQAGAKTCTFTASQGLLLKIPNMFKIAGELTPTVFHIAARSVASHALSIFCDHSDVMAARTTGFAILASNSVQEVMDMATIAEMASLQGRVPVLHFFDGFRTSHEVSKVNIVTPDMLQQLIDRDLIRACRDRALSPEHPVVRGTSQNPDLFFQSREASNPFYDAFPEVVQTAMDRFAKVTGRQYQTYQYIGSPSADKVIILMGSGAETAEETVTYLNKSGENTGLLKVRLFRPFDAQRLLDALPVSVNKIAVLDRTKEPGANGEPLYKDISTALLQSLFQEQSAKNLLETSDKKLSTVTIRIPKVIGGRFGLSSKEFTPAMVKAVFDELDKPHSKNLFTVGINDDQTHTSLDYDPDFSIDANAANFQALFYGLGADGTVSANKNSIKIIGEQDGFYAQGHFVYDSKKSGAITVSHLRFGAEPIHSAYEIQDNHANFIGCHQPDFLKRYPMLDKAKQGAVLLINTAASPAQAWETFPTSVQQQIIDKQIRVHIIDAYRVAGDAKLGKRINTIMQTCFFAISGVLPHDQAIAQIKAAVQKTYGHHSKRIVDLNIKAIDATLSQLHQLTIPAQATSRIPMHEVQTERASAFVKQLTAELIAGHGNQIPVSQVPQDGTWPTGTARYEKRDLAHELPQWEEDLCTHCGKCVLVCPHGVMRAKAFAPEQLNDAPAGFKAVPIKGAKEFPEGTLITYQISPQDCTGCTLCVDICPIKDKTNVSRKALNMVPKEQILAQEKDNWAFFEQIPEFDRKGLKTGTIKGAMLMQPLFEFSGACSGCGETSYIRLASQLFGDRMLVANATGCSSIYGGNLPTTPWTKNHEGRGPAWNNSLFEDNAEFGLGMRAAVDKQHEYARELLIRLTPQLDQVLVEAILSADQAADKNAETGIEEQRQRVAELRKQLDKVKHPDAPELAHIADQLCRKSVWIIGGDGWAYDIGYGGLDHVLASNRNVNILVLDTEVYSNTGGQTSKATPLGAVAKFSAAGKSTGKKDLARLAMDYGHVYVAHVAYAGKDVQTLRTFLEAESYDGPSLIIAYSPCIAHGYELQDNHLHQKLAVESGHWPLFRYDPRKAAEGKNPLKLDSKAPSIPYAKFALLESRFSMLYRTHPEEAKLLLERAQHEVSERYKRYEQLAEMDWQAAPIPEAEAGPEPEIKNKKEISS